ncbi:MAG: hypothetical protein R6X25_16625 [Candidatus Krumholzibacteriia bacterium]
MRKRMSLVLLVVLTAALLALPAVAQDRQQDQRTDHWSDITYDRSWYDDDTAMWYDDDDAMWYDDDTAMWYDDYSTSWYEWDHGRYDDGFYDEWGYDYGMRDDRYGAYDDYGTRSDWRSDWRSDRHGTYDDDLRDDRYGIYGDDSGYGDDSFGMPGRRQPSQRQSMRDMRREHMQDMPRQDMPRQDMRQRRDQWMSYDRGDMRRGDTMDMMDQRDPRFGDRRQTRSKQLQGEIVGIEKVQSRRGRPESVVMKVRTRDGQTRKLVLGDVQHVRSEMPALRKNERVTILGNEVERDGQTYFKANRVRSAAGDYDLPQYSFDRRISGELVDVRSVRTGPRGDLRAVVGTLRTDEGRTVDVLLGSPRDLQARGTRVRPGNRVLVTGYERNIAGDRMFNAQELQVLDQRGRPTTYGWQDQQRSRQHRDDWQQSDWRQQNQQQRDDWRNQNRQPRDW